MLVPVAREKALVKTKIHCCRAARRNYLRRYCSTYLDCRCWQPRALPPPRRGSHSSHRLSPAPAHHLSPTCPQECQPASPLPCQLFPAPPVPWAPSLAMPLTFCLPQSLRSPPVFFCSRITKHCCTHPCPLPSSPTPPPPLSSHLCSPLDKFSLVSPTKFPR